MRYKRSLGASADALEPRTLLAASITVNSHQTLTITGTNHGETISVLSQPGAVYHVIDGAISKDISQFMVKSIVVDALGGDDVITLQSARPSTVDGGAGDDRVSGAHGVVMGGTGDDAIVSCDGSLDGGPGDDSISASSSDPLGSSFLSGDDGNDTLTGGSGSDSISGGNGNDILAGHAGNDTLDGGLGTDTFSGGEGEDLVTYGGRTENLKLSLDGIANDGAPGENENIPSDVEDIFGGQGNDSIVGDDGPNLLVGDDPLLHDDQFGTDTILGLGGNDTVFAQEGGADPGLGDNLILGGAVDLSSRTTPIAVNLHNGTGFFSPLSGTVDTAGEHDTFGIGPGGEFELIRPGVTTIRLGSGDDSVVVHASIANRLSIFGNGGNDSISILNRQGALIDGGDGNDTLKGGTGSVTLRGGAGADTLIGNAQGKTILDYSDHATPITANLATLSAGSVGEGDVLVGHFLGIVGGSGNDSIVGTTGNDFIDGGTGNDTLSGLSGDDELRGGDGADSIDGGQGNDGIDGGAGDDTLIGGAGDDLLSVNGFQSQPQNIDSNLVSGNDGNDTVISGYGRDTIFAGKGDDEIIATLGNTDVSGGAGIDQVVYDESVDLRLSLDNQPNDGPIGGHANLHTDIEQIFSGDGNDSIVGDSADNTINGNGGDDTIHGMGGNDSITGDDGKDKLFGDAGNDTLDGGHRVDEFFGGDGDDTFFARDGNRETVDGGGGNDTVNRDYKLPNADVLISVESAF